MDAAEIVAEVNRARGTSYHLVRRLAGGRQAGAFQLTDGTAPVVLKWFDDPAWADRIARAARLVSKARAAGYPTPAWLAVGTTSTGTPYHLQEYVHGTPLADASPLDLSLAEQLVGISETQRELVSDRQHSWSDYVRGVVYDGWGGSWAAARATDDHAAQLIDRYERVCHQYRDAELPATDLVHGDLNVSNLLVRDGRIAAVIDVEAASGGTRAYDLVTLAASAARDGAAAGVDEYLFEAALRAAGRPAAAVSAAAGYADLVGFALAVDPSALPLIHRGGERMLDLLQA